MTPKDDYLTDRQEELLELMDYRWQVLLGKPLSDDFYESDEEAEKVFKLYQTTVGELIAKEILSQEE